MVSTFQPTQADFTRSSPLLPVGADNGAGLGKFCFGSGSQQMRVRSPSKVLEIKEPLLDSLVSKEGGHFYYHSGSREDLIGREFLTGTLAAWKAPTTHIKLSDDPALKAEYALHTLLGALATLPFRIEWNFYLVLSIHNLKLFKSQLMNQTNGTHIISFGGKDKPQSRVNVTVSLVASEGAGSYSYCLKQNLIDKTAHAIAFDIGTSTTIPVVFAPNGKLIYHQPLETGGCIDLLDAIASDSELVKFLGTGKAGSIETIRQGIESGTFEYGSRTFNFRSIYARHVSRWLADRVRLSFKQVAEWRDSAQSLVAWGGGVEMPGVASALKSQGIVAVPEGGWANAVGLQRMAESLMVRGK
jgi:hypothetical protein